jgi:hypothetical protein
MKESSSTPISTKRLAELAALPDGAIDTSDIAEADEAFFQSARQRLRTDEDDRSE